MSTTAQKLSAVAAIMKVASESSAQDFAHAVAVTLGELLEHCPKSVPYDIRSKFEEAQQALRAATLLQRAPLPSIKYDLRKGP